MPDVPNTAQLVLLGLSLAAFLGGIALSFARMKWADDRIRALAAKILSLQWDHDGDRRAGLALCQSRQLAPAGRQF